MGLRAPDVPEGVGVVEDGSEPRGECGQPE